MNVSHHDIDDYLQDLSLAVQEGEMPTVRADVDVLTINEGVSRVSVVSGFHDGNHFYELNCDAGELLRGDKTGEVTKHAAATIKRIRDECERLGVRFGGGRWHNL